MELEAVIGLELHVQMNTKSKMFSSAPVTFGDEPNSHVEPMDIAFPGALPLVNKKAVINGIRMAHFLHMEIDDELWFDRKNYFYSDLPKGYQITQHKRPLGKNGYLIIKTSLGEKRIDIERLHLEEDTCKQTHSKSHSYLDYNRAGIPLIEIVSTPTLSSGEEAMKFVEEIRSLAMFLSISSGKMEEGSLRVDVNISLREKGTNKLGPKAEIKNINTLNNVQKAIDYEIKRQKSLYEEGHRIIQETRRFDEANQKTVLMRLKTDSIDYKYYTEVNIPPIRLTKDFIDEAINSSPELASSKYERYKKLGLNDSDISLLLIDKQTSDYFDELLSYQVNPKLASNWINGEIRSYLNKERIDITSFPITPSSLAELITAIEKEKISNKQGREIFVRMIRVGGLMKSLIDEETNATDNGIDINNIVKQILDESPNLVSDYKNGKSRIVGFVVGEVMKRTKGKANPALTNKMVIEELKRR